MLRNRVCLGFKALVAGALLVFGLESGVLGQSPLALTETPASSGFFTANVSDTFAGTGSGNAKVWTIEAEGGDRVTIWAESRLTGTDLRLRLRDIGDSDLASATGNFNGEVGIQNYEISTPGTYKVVIWADDRTTEFALRVDLGRGFRMEAEGNQTSYTASALDTTTTGGGFSASTAGAIWNDADYFWLGSLGAGNSVNVSVALPSTSTLVAGDVEAVIFREGQEATPLATSTTGTLNATVVASGNYYLKVNTPEVLAGRSLRFDGDGDAVDLGNPALLQITGDQTIEFWIKPDDFVARRNPWAKAYGGEGTMTLETDGEINYFYGTDGGNDNPYQTFGTEKNLKAGRWQHVALVRRLDSAPQKLFWYLNGTLVAEADALYFPAVAGSLNALIGRGYTSHLLGNLDEFRVWNTARSQAEIQANMDNVLTGSESGLVAYYPFAEGSGVVLDDATANALDGTIEGDPTWIGTEGTGTFSAARQGLLGQYVASITVTDATAPTVTRVTPIPVRGPEIEGVPGLLQNPGNMVAYRGNNGTSYNVQVRGSTSGSLWGTDIYTDDSSLAKAAVHTGLLEPGENGIVTVTILPGAASYLSTTRNGITSSSYSSYIGSYSLSAYSGPAPTLNGLYGSLKVEFSEWMDSASLSGAGNLELRHAGDDATLDTGDDHVHSLAVSHDPSTNRAVLAVVDNPLQPGLHRLRVTTHVEDRSGNGLAADSDHSFTVVDVPPYTIENRDNGTRLTATSLGMVSGSDFDGSFALTHDVVAGDAPEGVGVLDLNGDGDLDAVVALRDDDAVAVCLGNGDGSFTVDATYVSGDRPWDLELVNIDADPALEVVVSCYNSNELRLYDNPGDGTLTPSGSVALGDSPRHIALGMFNADSFQDLAVTNRDTGTGGRSVSILLGDGLGGFSESKLTVAGNVFRPWGLAVADVNKDSEHDLLVGDMETEDLRVFLGNGDGTFGAPASFDLDDTNPSCVAVGDIDHDGNVDVIVGTEYDNNVSMLFGNGDGTFQPFEILPVGSSTYQYFVELEDIDGDGWVDLLLPRSNGLHVAYNLGSMTEPGFTAVRRYSIGDLRDAAVADVNDDGRPDVVVAQFAGDRLRTLLGRAVDGLATDATESRVLHGYGRGYRENTSDDDWFSFSVEEPRTLVVAQDNPGSLGNSGLNFDLIDINGSVLSSFSAGVSGIGQGPGWFVSAPGTYYIRLRTNYSYDGEYAFRLSSFDPSVVIESETNDTMATADPTSLTLGVGTLTGSSAGYISATDSSGDYWALGNLGAGADITLDLTLPASSPLTAVMEIFKADGTQVAVSNPGDGQLAFSVTAGNESAYVYRVTESGGTGGLRSEYVVDVTIADPQPPSVVGTTLPAEGSTATYVDPYFTVTFTEDMLADTVNDGGNFDLRSSGVDAVFDTADDEIYTVSPQSYASGLTASFHVPDGPLQPGSYRFTAGTGLTDNFANPLASSFVQTFSVVGVPGYVLESRSNDSLAEADSISIAPSGDFDGSFSLLGNTDAGTRLWGLKMLDLDGDGHKEAITTKYTADQLTVFPGNGDGTFGTPTDYPTGEEPWGVELINVDGDGDLDIAVSCADSDELRIFLNQGDGTLLAGAIIPVGDRPVHVVSGRFNNDAIPDLAVANEGTGTGGRSLTVLFGDGAAGFTSTTLTVGSQTVDFYALAVGDFNGDTLDDLAAGDWVSESMAVFLNTGGSFGAPAFFPIDDNDPTGASVADFDQDGNLDLLVCPEYDNLVSILRGNGDGTFQPFETLGVDGSAYMYFAESPDLNGDGWADLLISRYNGVVVRYNRGTGGLDFSSAIRMGNSDDTGGVVACDVNSDSRMDIVAASYNLGDLFVFTGNGTEGLAEDGQIPGLRVGALRGWLTTNSDEDWYTFSAMDEDRILFSLESPTRTSNSGRTVNLYNYAGTRIGGFSGDSRGWAEWSAVVSRPGRYYVRVTNSYNGTQEYRLRVALARPPTLVESENNDSVTQVNNPPLALGAGQLTGKVLGVTLPNDPAGDYFGLGNLSPGSEVTLTVEALQSDVDLQNARQARQLAHRWSFGETAGATEFTDSVTGLMSAELLGTGATVSGGEVSLPGGPSGTAPYIDLPNGLASSRTADATFETWVTLNGSQYWSRIFTLGSGTAGEITGPGGSATGQQYLFLSAQNASNQTNNRVALAGPTHANSSDFTVPYNPGQRFHVAIVYRSGAAFNGNPVVQFYRDGALVGSFEGREALANISDPNCWLGRSQWTNDNNTQADYSEFRVWDGAMAAAEVAASSAAGPDALPAAVPSSVAALPEILLYKTDGTLMERSNASSDTLQYTLGPGDGAAYAFRVYDPFGSAASRYRVSITIADTEPPSVVADTLPAEGSTVTFPRPDFTLTFSEDMLASTVTDAANYELRNAGANGVFDDGDDILYTLTHGAYTNGLSHGIHIADGPLQVGDYRFTAGTGLQDLFQQPTQAAYVRTFTVVDLDGFLTESRDNDTLATADILSGVGMEGAGFDGSYAAQPAVSTGGETPFGFVLVDLNDDGDLDAVVSHSDSSNVGILLGDGAGGFGPASLVAVGSGPRRLAKIDFDKDMDDDIVVAVSGTDEVVLLRNDENGTLAVHATLPAGDHPLDVRTGDFNNDTNPDFAVTQWGTGVNGRRLSLFLGDGLGGFVHSYIADAVTAPWRPYHLAVGDFDGNDIDDIAVANYDSNDVIVLLATGGGNFAAEVRYTTDRNNPTGLEAADLNGDFIDDLLVAYESYDRVNILRGNGDGTFQGYQNWWLDGTRNQYAVKALDLNGDGYRDIVAPRWGSLTGRRNKATPQLDFHGAFSRTEVGQAIDADVADLNGDGRLDLVGLSYSLDELQVYLGQGPFFLASDGSVSGFAHGFVRGNLDLGSDRDFFEFSAAAGQKVAIAAETFGAPSSSGYWYTLQDLAGNTLASTWASASNGYALVQPFTVPYDGRFFLQVAPNWTNTFEYRARVSVIDPMTQAETEGNDSIGAADVLELTPGIGTRTAKVFGHHAGNDGSGDWFALGNLANGTDVNLMATAPQPALDHASSRQSLSLRHRWSFGEAEGATQFTDSITGLANAELKGSGGVVGGGEVTLPGGSSGSAAYVDLPNGVASATTEDLTIEGWVTINGSQSWSRVFDFGTTTVGEVTDVGGSFTADDSLTVAAQEGTNQSRQTFGIRNSGVANSQAVNVHFTQGQEFHFAIVYDADGNGTRSAKLRFYRDGLFVASISTNLRPADLMDDNCWLGRSMWSNDGNLNGAYNEFRIWDGAFTDSEVVASHAAGPDALPSASAPAIAALPILTLHQSDGSVVATAVPGDGPLQHSVAASDAYYFRVWHRTRDLNALYRINVSLTDSLPPQITGTTLPAEGASTTDFLDSFGLDFNEDLQASTVNDAANYELREAGADTVLGSSDDVLFTVVPGTYTSGLTNTYSIPDGPLSPGSYRLTVSNIKDTYGSSLTSPFVRTFTVAQVPGFTSATPGNNTPGSATMLLQIEDPSGLITAAGRGRRTSTGDVDYWSFDAVAGQKLTLDTFLVGAGGSTNLYWTIRKPDSTVVYEAALGNNDLGAFVPVMLDTTGTYTLAVSNSSTWLSEYRFRLSLIDPTQLQLELEDNGVIGTASPLNLTTAGGIDSALATGLIHEAADLDYFSLGPIAGGKTVFLSAQLPSTSSFLPVVAVYDSSGSFVSEVNGVPGDAAAEVRITVPDTYYMLVRSTGGTGDYLSQYVSEVQIHDTASVTSPNLQVTAVDLPPESGLQSGDSFTYHVVITNVGNANIPAQPWSDRIVLSENQVYGDSDDIEVGAFPRNAALDMGQNYTLTGQATLPQGLVGNFHLIARTDIADQVDELVLENDNTTATSGTFPVALAPYPDLEIQNLAISGPVADVFTFNWDLANSGNLDAPDGFKERVVVVNTSTGQTLLDDVRQPGALAFGDSLARSAQVTTNVAGVYEITVIVDSDDDLFEHDGVSHSTAEVNAAADGFNILQYWTVNASTPDPSRGGVTGGGIFLDGANVTVTATPDTSTLPYQFVRWTSGGAFVSANAVYSFPATMDRDLVAEFALASYQVAAVISPPAAGSVAGAGFYEHGSAAALTATAGQGYLFDHWEEGGSNIGSNATLNLTVTSARTITAIFAEANPTHVVTTATEPPQVGGTTGAGTFDNGEVSAFSAPASFEEGDTEYLFDHWKLNGVYFGDDRTFEKTFSTLDAPNMAFVAHYTSRSLKPVVDSVAVNYGNPIRAASDVRFTLTFDRPMDTGISPVLALASLNASTAAMMPPGGSWLSPTQFESPPVTFVLGNDGAYQLNASVAADTNGRVMAAADVYAFDVDATPPVNPVPLLTSSNANSAVINWNAYSPPGDINGFRVYLHTADYADVGALLPVSGKNVAARSHTFNGLQPDTDYFASVVAVDAAGNADSTVTTLRIFLDSDVPPAVAFNVTAPAPETAHVDWTGYSTSGLVGFQGFHIYMEESAFVDVSALTPVMSVASNVREYDAIGLDRTKTYHIAVVGYNRLNELNPAVTPQTWSDPLAGNITSDLTVGTVGASSDVNVLQSMTVKSGATLTLLPGTTLRFASGTGLTIEGALVAEGTPLLPINLTSSTDTGGGTPARGDWAGVTLKDNTNATRISHVWVRYGSGLLVNGGQPQVGSLFAARNLTRGLGATGSAVVNLTNSFFALNDTGVVADGTAQVTISQSVIRSNTNFSARQSVGATLNLASNWWGTTDTVEIGDSVDGTVNTSTPLGAEPVLTEGMATTGGLTTTGSRNLSLDLASANGTAYRLSEDSNFPSVLWTDIFAPGEVNTYSPYPFTAPFMLSAGGGVKSVYAQFRSITGEVSPTQQVDVTLITAGPMINSFSLTDGQTMTRPIQVTGNASAALGMQNIQFFEGSNLLASAAGGVLNFRWDIRSLTPGPYRVKLLARDNAGNVTTREINVNVAPAPPPAPVFLTPPGGTRFNTSPIAVTGTAEPGVEVRITRNGTAQGTVIADAGGNFAAGNVGLAEGVNTLVATAADSIGTRPSSGLQVVLDSGPPVSVLLLDPPRYDPFRGLVLLWQFQATGERPIKYKVFWHNAPFTDPATASGQSGFLNAQTYTITSAPDGPLHIGVVGYDSADNASPLSNLISYTLDRTAPAFTVGYNRTMPAGPGPLEIVVTSSEPLASNPLMTITPNGLSSPISVPLTQVSSTSFSATYNVSNLSARTGPAVVEISGTDLTGNNFTGAPGGTPLSFDVTAPTGTLTFDQPPPYKTVSNVDPNVPQDLNLSFTLALSEEPKPGTTPSLTFTPPIGSVISPTLSGSGTSWTGSVNLTSAMGKGFGQWVLTVTDGRDNVGNSVTPTQIEIYNTEHPDAPGIPVNLRATTLVDGEIKIEWDEVSDAESYRIYREPGNTGVTPTVLVAEDIMGTMWTDKGVPEDGIYRYAIKAFRVSVEGSPSGTLNALSDSTPPDAPENAAVNLTVAGVEVTWDAPSGGEVPHRYHVYRNGTKIRTVNTPRTVLDFPPRGLHQYEVAAADSHGNESRSAPIAFEFFVDAVDNLKAIVREGQPTTLQWDFSDSAGVGYNIYRNGIKQNGQPIAVNTKTFSDLLPLPADEAVDYRVTAVDDQDREGAPRTVRVQPVVWGFLLNFDPIDGEQDPVTRFFDRFDFTIGNNDATFDLEVGGIEINRMLSGGSVTAVSEEVDLMISPGSEDTVSVAVPGAQQPLETQDLEISINSVPNEGGSSVCYIREGTIGGAVESPLMLELRLPDLPLAGGLTDVNVRIHNRGFAPIDVVLGRSNGQEDGDLIVQVQDESGVTLSQRGYNGVGAPGLIIRPNGDAYVPIPVGESVEVTVPDLLVPAALADVGEAMFYAELDQVFSGLGMTNQRTSGPLDGTLTSTITETPYFGTATTIKEVYSGDEAIVIEGQSIDRSSSNPQGGLDMRIGFAARGAVWYEDITTEPDGSYSFSYTPFTGFAGELTIWAAHPEVFDVLAQRVVKIYRLYVTPSFGDIRMSKNDHLDFTLGLINPGDLPLSNVGLGFRAYQLDMDGVTEIPVPQITCDFLDGTGPGDLPASGRENAEMRLVAAVDAPDNAMIEVTYTTDEGASATFTGEMELLQPVPILSMTSPRQGFVDVTVDRGGIVSREITLENLGTRALLDVELVPPQAIPWMQINLPTNPMTGNIDLPDLEVGETTTFTVAFVPPPDTPLGYQQDTVNVRGSNAVGGFDFNLFALVSSTATGSLDFHVGNFLGQNVPNAEVRVMNLITGNEIGPLLTDANGDVTFSDLVEGAWSWQVIASGHKTTAGTVDVVPDQTVAVEVELTRSLVTVTFQVKPVPFTDRYEIVIEQTFLTFVPAPVLVMSPPKYDFGNVEPGFETTVIYELKNEGLIKTFDVDITGTTRGIFTIEPLIQFIPEMLPQQVIEIPARIRLAENIFAGGGCGDGGGLGGFTPPVEQGDGYTFGGPSPTIGNAIGGACDTPNLADFLNGIAAIASMGGSGCFQSQSSGSLGTALAVALAAATVYEVVTAIPSAGTRGVVEVIGEIAQTLAQCAAAHYSGSGSGGGGSSGGDRGPGRATGYGSGGAGCFTPETLVLLADGSRVPFEDLTVGDEVQSGRDPRETARIREVYELESDELFSLKVRAFGGVGIQETREIRVTGEHMLWRDGDGWLAARLIEEGDWLHDPGGGLLEVVSMDPIPGRHRVMTLQLQYGSTFYPGGILAQDLCGGLYIDREAIENLQPVRK